MTPRVLRVSFKVLLYNVFVRMLQASTCRGFDAHTRTRQARLHIAGV